MHLFKITSRNYHHHACMLCAVHAILSVDALSPVYSDTTQLNSTQLYVELS